MDVRHKNAHFQPFLGLIISGTNQWADNLHIFNKMLSFDT